MRLWHERLLPVLPNKQLSGQNRECAAMRGQGWGVAHAIVNYVWTHSLDHLAAYHCAVHDVMMARGYKVHKPWSAYPYADERTVQELYDRRRIYPEHDDRYLVICLYNLLEKNIDLWEYFPHVAKWRI